MTCDVTQIYPETLLPRWSVSWVWTRPGISDLILQMSQKNFIIFFPSNSIFCKVYQNQIQPSFIQVLRFLFVYFLWKIKAGKMLQFSIITMIPSYKIKHRETLKYKLFRKNKSNSALCKQSIGNKKKTVPFLESSCFRGRLETCFNDKKHF